MIGSPATNSRLLAVRTLNELRMLHPQTYVALRYLLDSSVTHKESGWIEQVLPWKYGVGREPRFWPSLRFKKRDNQGNFEYREFLIPSPTTALAEAVVLQQLCLTLGFWKQQYVYSYRWPEIPNHPYSFEHFMTGYKARARDICQVMALATTNVAVIADIEKFYPHINQRSALARFHGALERSRVSEDMKVTAKKLADHVLVNPAGGQGIAIGPLTSHILGDLALAPVDQAMAERYPGRYFRYVDDIVIVVPSGQEETALADLQHALAGESLNLNLEKKDFIASGDWLSHCPDQTEGDSEDKFESLVFRIKVFLSFHPASLDSLERAFRREGMALPLRRLLAAAERPSFQRRVRYLMRKGWRAVWYAVSDTEDTLIIRALGIRQKLLEKIRGLTSGNITSSGMKRRWLIQEMRYAVNRLAYLLPQLRFAELAQITANMPELIETTVFLCTVTGSDLREALKFPGPSVTAAAAFLHREGNSERSPVITHQLAEAEVHSVATFLLYGACSISAGCLSQLDSRHRDFLKFSSGETPAKRVLNDFSYLDEIRSLQLGRQPNDRTAMLDHRFSYEEMTAFEALYIGEYYDA